VKSASLVKHAALKITNVMAISLDGRIASHPGETDKERLESGFTSQDDFEHLLGLIRSADAIIVGSSSLQASGQAFSVVNDRGRYPIWVVMSRKGLPAGQPFYDQAELPRWIVTETAAKLPAHKGEVRHLAYGNDPAPDTIVNALAAAGCERVLLFGGASVNREFYSAGLVDRLIVTVCPLIVARSEALPLVQPPVNKSIMFSLASSQVVGNLVILSYDLIKS